MIISNITLMVWATFWLYIIARRNDANVWTILLNIVIIVLNFVCLMELLCRA